MALSKSSNDGAYAASDGASDADADAGAGDLRGRILALGAQVAGAPVDGAKSLFDNGLHSLRAVELVGKINRA